MLGPFRGERRKTWGFNANDLSEFSARKESPLKQVSFHVIDTRDLNGLTVEPINVFHEGLVAPLGDFLKGGLSLQMSTRHHEVVDELVLEAPPGGDRPGGEVLVPVYGCFSKCCGEQSTFNWPTDVVVVEHFFKLVDVFDMIRNAVILL